MDVLRPHVLVVDDSPDAADSMAELCGLRGYDADPRYSGASALAAVRGRRPAVVLLDIGMAPMDGFTFTAHLRQLRGCERTPVVAISGHTSAAHQARARALGIAHYLMKPADLDQVRLLLQRLVAEFETESQPDMVEHVLSLLLDTRRTTEYRLLAPRGLYAGHGPK